VSQPQTKRTPVAASAMSASSHLPSSSLLDAPLDRMIADPWAKQAATSPWGDTVDTVAASQPDMWSARRSPSPGQIAACVLYVTVRSIDCIGIVCEK